MKDSDDGFAERVDETELTVRLTVVVRLMLGEVEVPVMVIAVGPPVIAPLPAMRVRVLELVVLLGLNDAVTPLGMPEADSATLPVKPLRSLTVTVLEPLAPCAIVRLLGDAESVKSGDADTPDEMTRLTALPDATCVALVGF